MSAYGQPELDVLELGERVAGCLAQEAVVRLTAANGRELRERLESKPHYGTGGLADGLSLYTPGGRVVARFGDRIAVRGSVAVAGYPQGQR